MDGWSETGSIRARHRLGCAVAVVVAVLAVSLSSGRQARADLFDRSPGPLSGSHSTVDGEDDCTECHDDTEDYGLSGKRCLKCHSHDRLKKSLDAGRGFHAHISVRDLPCKSCHLEHTEKKGKLTRWSVVGGEGPGFPHERTGYDLTGGHKGVACSRCHTTTWKKTKRVSYGAASRRCESCHKDPHRIARPEKLSCDRCHTVASFPDADVSRAFNHNSDTSFALTDKHALASCEGCHGDKLVFGRGELCAGCHASKSPHEGLFARKDCKNCHGTKAWTEPTLFKHAKMTRFPLVGEHAEAKCEDCHKPKMMKAPRAACEACHKNPHEKRFGKRKCTECHKPVTFIKESWFNHTKTRFKLTGAHDRAKCRDCHRGETPVEFEKFKTSKCIDCHVHVDVHKDEPDFLTKPCESCHIKKGLLVLVSKDPHKGSPFHKTGGHKKTDCKDCHETLGYKDVPRTCVTCHAKTDPHEKSLGASCEKCHGGKTPLWKPTAFVHNTMSVFKIDGVHKPVKCVACHGETKRYKPTPMNCAGCHAGDDLHAGRLGARCEDCHNVLTRTHYSHTRSPTFPIYATERHSTLPCAECHKDRRFRPTPADCVSCHADPHGGRYGADCSRCHTPATWESVATAHEVGTFRFAGAHDDVPCARCHAGRARMKAGTGELCMTCHRVDDIHRNALGPECGDCHTQRSWMPPTWKHIGTGFALTGSHRFAACEKCHSGGVYGPLPSDCISCHNDDRMRVIDTHADRIECADCHFTTAWRPAGILR